MNAIESLELADAVIADLDQIATRYQPRSSGLPIWDAAANDRMRAAVLRRLREFLEKMRVDALKESL